MGGNSTIKPKVGTCQDCRKTTYLTAGRCRACYWANRAKINSKKPAAKAKRAAKDELTPWFNMQLTMAPAHCENVACREPLTESMAINPRTIVAHILPKSRFPEVATHPLNRVFLCQSCHYKYDNGKAETMPEVLRLCGYRLGMFINKVAVDNFKSIPGYFNYEQGEYIADR